MLRFLASAAFGCQAVWYGIAAIRNAVLLADVAPLAAALMAGFWGVAALLLLTSSVVLFRSRGESSLRGGRRSLALVLVACVVTALIATIFALAATGETLKDLPISAEAQQSLRSLFVLLAAQSAFIGSLGALAAVLPYLKRGENAASGRPLPAS